MKTMTKMALVAACIALTGCGPQKARVDPETQQKLIRENEMRLASLESSVNALNSQVAQINNRVYEVRTKGGQKTSMTVVPVATGAQGAAPTMAANQTSKPASVGKKIDPAPKPAPAKKKAATPPAAKPDVAGPSGQLAAQADVALPPADLPPSTPVQAPSVQNTGQSVHGRVDNNAVPVPQGNATDDPTAPPVPVPLLPTSDLSLPPEQPAAPQVAQAQPAATQPAVATRRKAQAGEQAAYNAALNAARSGRTAEGITLFRDFLQKYPQGPYSANAEYWIGECLYAQGKFPEAASQFESVNNTYPKHHKNADALLKAGMTLSKMGDKAAAQEKYRTLIANFPNTEAARRARAMGAR